MHYFIIKKKICDSKSRDKTWTYIEIPVIKRHQFGQFIREEGPQSHLVKQGTPTMGGIAIYLAVTIATLIGTKGRQDSLVIIVIGFI